MDNERRRLVLAEKIAQFWNDKGFHYAVVHGLGQYPDKIGRDLDIAVLPEHVFPMVKAAIKIGCKCGFSIPVFRWSHWGLYQLVLLNPDRMISLPLDFLCTTAVWRAKWIQMVDKRDLSRIAYGDSWNGPFRISIEGTFYKACVRPILCGDLRKFWKEYPLPVLIPHEVDMNMLENMIGRYGLHLLNEANLNSFAAHYPGAVQKLQWNWIYRHPFLAAKSLLEAIVSQIERRLFNSPIFIALKTKDKEFCFKELLGMTADFKNIFVDLRVQLLATSKYAGIWDKYNNPPISEFVVVVNIFSDKDDISADYFDKIIECRNGHASLIDAVINILREKYNPNILVS